MCDIMYVINKHGEKQMKILHTGDIHLDSAFCAVSSTEANALRQHQRDILKKIFKIANEEACDMILISGDLFDTCYVTPETRELCLSLFSDFQKPIIISPGNHDPLVDGSFYKSSLLPENTFVFTRSELQYFDFPELKTTVAGYAFTSSVMTKSPLEGEVAQRENQPNLILCAHADLDSVATRYAPLLTSDILRHGFIYTALGHIHKVPETPEHIRYCGFPEGRGFDEQGDGGVLIVSIDDTGAVSAKRIITSDIRYLTEELSVTGMSCWEIERAVASRIEDMSRDCRTAIRLELVGVLTEDTLPDITSISKANNEQVISVEIINSTLCLPSSEGLEKDITLRGELYRTLKGKLMSDDREERRTALLALKIGLSAIDGKDFTDGGVL